MSTAQTRPDWDQYFLEIAKVVAKRSTCSRKQVGAVIADARHRIVSAGYNGSPAGTPHCTDEDVGCLLKNIEGRDSCIRTIHAEANALAHAGTEGYRTRGWTIYVTVTPCYECAKLIIQAGVQRVVYAEYYQSQSTELVMALFKEVAITVEQILPETTP